MRVSNPHNLCLHDIIAYLDTLAIKEETKKVILPPVSSDYEKTQQLKKVRIAQLLLRIAKAAAINKQPGQFQDILTELPENNEQ